MPVQATRVSAKGRPMEPKSSSPTKCVADDIPGTWNGKSERKRVSAPFIMENVSLSATRLHPLSCAMRRPETHRPTAQLAVTLSPERDRPRARDAGGRAPVSPWTEERSLELLLLLRSSEGVDGLPDVGPTTAGARTSPFFIPEGLYDTIHVRGVDSLSVSMTRGGEDEKPSAKDSGDASTPKQLFRSGDSWDGLLSQAAFPDTGAEQSCSTSQQRHSQQMSFSRPVANPEREFSASELDVSSSASSDFFRQGSGMNLLDVSLCPSTFPAMVEPVPSSSHTEGSVVGDYETSALELPVSEIVDKGPCCGEGGDKEKGKGGGGGGDSLPMEHPAPEWEKNRVNTAVILNQSPYADRSWCTILADEQAVELPSFLPSLENGKERLVFDEVIRLCPGNLAGFRASARLSGLLQLFISGYNTVMILGYNGAMRGISEDFIVHTIQSALLLIEQETKQNKRIASFDITLRMSAVKPSESKACDLMRVAGEFRDMVIGRSPLYGPCLLEMEDVELEMRASTCAAQIRAAFGRCPRERGVRMIIATLRLKQLQNSSKMSVFVSSMQLILLSDPVTLIKGGSAPGGASTIVQCALSGPYATLLVGCLNEEPGHREWINLISQRGGVAQPPLRRVSLNNLLRETVLPDEDSRKERAKCFSSGSPHSRSDKSLNPFEGRITRRCSIAFTDVSDTASFTSTGTMSPLSKMGGGSNRIEMHDHNYQRRRDRPKKSSSHEKDAVAQQLQFCDEFGDTVDSCSKVRLTKQHRLSERRAEIDDGLQSLASWKQIRERHVSLRRNFNRVDGSAESSMLTITPFDSLVLQEKLHKVRTVVVLISVPAESNVIIANAANVITVRPGRGETPTVLFTADEVLHSAAEKSLRRSWEIKQAVRLFALGYNAAIMCNTIHPSASKETDFVAMPEWTVLLEELEFLLDKESMPTGVCHEIQFSMCIIDGHKVIRDILRCGEEDNAGLNSLVLSFSPILGTGVSGATYIKLKEARYMLRLRAAIHSASEFMYSYQGASGHCLLVTKIVLRQFDASAMSCESDVRDVVLSSLLVTSTFARTDREAIKGGDKDAPVSPANPFIDVAAGRPYPLFQFSLGGPCHTVSCINLGGDTCGPRALAALHAQRFINAIANRPPLHGSVRHFLERSEETCRREKELLEKARRKGKDTTAIMCRIERLVQYMKGYRRFMENPMAEDPTYI